MHTLFDKYRFRIVRPGQTDRRVTPAIDNFRITWRKEENSQLFAHNLEAGIEFDGTDFEYFRNIKNTEECPDIKLEIDAWCKNQWSATPIVSVRIDVRKGEWDIDRCIVTFDTLPVNGLECLKENWGDTKNVLQITQKHNALSVVGTISTQQDVENFTDEPTILIIAPRHANEAARLADGWRPVLTTITFTAYDEFNLSSGTITTNWQRETATVPCQGGVGGTLEEPPGGGWTLVQDNCATLGTSDWYRVLETTLFNVTLLNGGVGPDRQWAFTSAAQLELDIDNGVTLQSVFDLFNDCGFAIKSNYFGINHDSSPALNAAYVYAEAYLQNILLFQKSDITNHAAAQNATSADLTLKQLLDGVQAWHPVDYTIIGNTLVIEHISFFKENRGLDLTVTDPTALEGTNRYTVDREEIPIRERFEAADQTRIEFDGQPITYSPLCTSVDESLDRKTEYFSFDIEYAINKPEEIDITKGFFMVAVDVDAGGQRYFQFGASNGLLNGNLAMPVLQENVWQYDRFLLEGRVNGNLFTFQTKKKIEQQVPISFAMCCEDLLTFDPSLQIKSGLGWGEVFEAVYDAQSNFMEVQLLH